MKFLGLFLFFSLSINTIASANEWSYEGETGPNHWSNIPGDELCAKGLDQSPIAIETGLIPGFSNITLDFSLMPPQIAWIDTPLQLVNNGHTLQVVYQPGSHILFENKDSELKQFHFHSPSEHIIDQRQYPLEVHFVHQTNETTPAITVISILFKQGNSNPTLQTIWANAPDANTSKTVSQILISASQFLPATSGFYTYSGSLTTPPCAEGVTWIVLGEPIEASAEQLKFLKNKLGFENNRAVHPLDGRMIRAFE